MPIYEYQCKDCGSTFEVDQRIVDPPLDSCQMCGGAIERLISRCSFVLKGDGWYATEHPSQDRKKGIAKEKKSNGTSETKSAASETKSGTSETKSAASETKSGASETKRENKDGKTSSPTTTATASA